MTEISHILCLAVSIFFPLRSFWFQTQEIQLKLPVGEKET